MKWPTESKSLFIKKNHNNELIYSEFFQFSKDLAIKYSNIKRNDLVLVDFADPLEFLINVFAVLYRGGIPALLNTYYSQVQIDQILKDNKYVMHLTDKKTLINNTSHSSKELPLELENLQTAKIIFFTSGTTSPKACLLSLESLFYNAKGSFDLFPFKKGESWGLCLPHFHVGGFSIFIRAILNEGTVEIINTKDPLPKLEYLSLVSTQFHRLLEPNRISELKNIQHILLGGSAIPLNDIKKAIENGLNIHLSYGLTEMGSQVATTERIRNLKDLNYAKILNYRDVKVIDNEVYIKGPCLFEGYLLNNNLKNSRTDDGWFATKDMGEITESGLRIFGRKDRVIQIGGENISLDFIERIFLNIEGCSKCKVIANDHPEYGKTLTAYLDVENTSIEDIANKVKVQLKGFLLPKKILDYKNLPKEHLRSKDQF